MSEKFDVIVVGAGPSGNAAAYTALSNKYMPNMFKLAEIGGELVVESSPGEGTAVSVSVPVGAADTAPLQRTSP